jgi:hypothetical protein
MYLHLSPNIILCLLSTFRSTPLLQQELAETNVRLLAS